MLSLKQMTRSKTSPTFYALFNLLIIYTVNKISDLPVWVKNWELKATQIASLQLTTDNFYPPGAAILLAPFLWNKPNYTVAVFFYFVAASIIYFFICRSLIMSRPLRIFALLAFSLNPYLVWLVNSSQDTVFELFLLLCGAALIVSGRFVLSFFPIYLLCLTRPAYWVFLLLLPLALRILKTKNRSQSRISRRGMMIPASFLLLTLGLNQIAFSSPSLAHEGGLTAHFSHNKFFYLSMPKFDMDVFLSTGGNMDPKSITERSDKFSNIEDEHMRAALISIVENPKSVVLNSLQKLDSYLFAVQKNPQLPGEYYLSSDQKSIVIGEERLTWTLILGNIAYFLYRAVLLISLISVATLFAVSQRLRQQVSRRSSLLLLMPFVCGIVPGLLFYTESRFKVVSEILLVPLIAMIIDQFRKLRSSEGNI
jgi:hypothetical protein